ncbi:MAG: hypothetical protein OXM02_05045 [Bacteroidota bacterium]|nr:hypothetical protein [Bacteroidota bacterium]MDE2956716.1 hypothetical protein [Bacteroidota bacterium]
MPPLLRQLEGLMPHNQPRYYRTPPPNAQAALITGFPNPGESRLPLQIRKLNYVRCGAS